jgi:SnoaL-like polyketide cyclase
MSAKENVQLMRRWFDEVWNQGKAETVRELLAEDAIGMGQGEADVKVRGPADFVPFVERIRGAFPDMNIKIEDAFGARDKVVVRWSATMTHKGCGASAGNGESVRPLR